MHAPGREGGMGHGIAGVDTWWRTGCVRCTLGSRVSAGIDMLGFFCSNGAGRAVPAQQQSLF